MDFKFILFYLALVFFFWRFNPFFPYNEVIFEYAHVIGIISGSYISIFLLYMFVKNYDEIKENLLRFQTKITTILVGKHRNSKVDFIRFFIFSILITFSIDIILTKISEQSFIGYILDNTPGLGETITTTGFNPKDISNVSNATSTDLKFGSIKNMLVIFIGPSIGAIILFFLRQISYREIFKNKRSYPGARLLFLFLIIALIAFTVDIYNEISKGFSVDPDLIYKKTNLNLFTNTYESNQEKSTDINYGNITKIIPYNVNHLIIFTFSNLIIPQFYMSIISIWIFDWYLFSRFWIRKQT